MPRLLPWCGVTPRSVEPLSGPRSRSSSGAEALDGARQTISAGTGYWRFALSFPPLQGAAARAWSAMAVGLAGGANAVRWPFTVSYQPSLREAGVVNAPAHPWGGVGVPWGNGQNWGNGQPWQAGAPTVPLAAALAKGDVLVALDPAAWGHRLEPGAKIGFTPGYFGLHEVTRSFGGGLYQVWPPLRAAIPLGRHATLNPVLAVRPVDEASASAGDGLTGIDAPTLTVVEVLDADVRRWYTE